MAKAILELEMPESCKQCKLGHYDELYDITHCDILRECMPYEGRHPDCPLKLVEGCEWILIDDDNGLWQCSKCGAEWVLEAGTPADNEMNYCPACGKRLEVEP